jgi:hypothetical protein
VPAHFDALVIGQVTPLGVAAVDAKALESFCTAFAPGWDTADGAPDALVFAIWSKLDGDLLDEAGRLVFSCLTRSVFACKS